MTLDEEDVFAEEIQCREMPLQFSSTSSVGAVVRVLYIWLRTKNKKKTCSQQS